MGADFFLASYEQAVGYLEKLATESPRIKVADMGPTSEGRRMKYAIISSEENMAKLDRYKEIVRKLSLGRGVSKEEAAKLADEGKVVVWIDVGLHASEVVPPQMGIQLAYDMVTGEDRRTRTIRENDILLLVYPNPDGMTMVSKWYMNNVGTPFEISPLPVQYQKYGGHDNNRDSFMANLIETQNVNRVISQEWYPEILMNQHQPGPFPARIWIPPFGEPTNPNDPSLVVAWRTLIGASMGKLFDEEDKSGVISRRSYDIFYPGYYASFVSGHNIPSIVTETQSYPFATPRNYTLADFPEEFRDLKSGAFYPNPWKGGWWRISDAINYNLTASKGVLDVAARYRYEFLYGRYTMAMDAIETYQKEPPFGWIVSANQRDASTTALMVERLMNAGVEVYTADQPFVHEGISYPKGSYIIPTSQPYGRYAKNVLEIQNYPDLRKYTHLWQHLVAQVPWKDAPLRPYDVTGWTLPLQMGVKADMMYTPLEVAKSAVTAVVLRKGEVSGTGAQYVFPRTDNNSYKAVNRILAAGGKVSYALEDMTIGGTKYPRGSFIVESASIPAASLQDIAVKTQISMGGGAVQVPTSPVPAPKVAIYKSFVVKVISDDRRVASADAGWISYIFERYDLPYHLLTDAEVKAGDLRQRFDVIILPDESAGWILNGASAGPGGESGGLVRPEYAGGIGSAGLDNLRKFVEDGGTLVCNNASSPLAIDAFHLPVKDVLEGLSGDNFNCPGSILKTNYDTSHPVAFGMEEQGVSFFGNGLAFEVKNAGKEAPKIVATFPDEPLLISGWLIGGEKMRGKAAVVDAPVGKGRAILFGFNVQNRAQAYGTMKLLLNAVYYREDLRSSMRTASNGGRNHE